MGAAFFTPEEYDAAKSYDEVRDNIGMVLYSKEFADSMERRDGKIYVKENLPGGIVAFLEVIMQNDKEDFFHAPISTEQVVDEVLDIEDMIDDAIDCMHEKLPAVFMNAAEMMNGLFGDHQFYVLSTNTPFGASAMIYDGVLDMVGSSLDCSFFILPSTRDWVVITPDDGTKDLDLLQKIHLEHVEKVCDEERFLSNDVLYYDNITRELTTAFDAKNDEVGYLNRTSWDWTN